MHGELLRLFGLQIHHAAHLGRGGGHHAQFRFVRAALHREGDAAPGGKVRGIGELQRLPVLRHGAEAVQQRTAPGSTAQDEWRSRVEEKAATAAEKSARVCLNTAAKEELLALPGVGEKTAERILAYRDTYGKFVTVEQLLDVEGIGEGLLEQLRPYVYVEESE